jgi:hypothetical protein
VHGILFVSAWLVAWFPRAARAVQYEVFVHVEAEEDLYDLLVSGQLSKRSFNALLLLYQSKVDLNRADRERLYALPNLDFAHVDRILRYRAEAGGIRSVEDLKAAGALNRELLDAIRAFLIVRSRKAAKPQTDGFTRVHTRWSGLYDRLPPAAAAQARVKTLRNLDIGAVVVLTRNDVHRVRWDQNRQGLSAEPERIRFVLPKLYTEWDDDEWEVVVGTYRIGFGQRLTFDVTDQVSPNGFFGDYELRRGNDLALRCRRSAGELLESPCPTDRVARVTPDYQWTNRLAGAAVGVRRVAVGPGWLQAYGWGSYQVHRVPQAEVANASACQDPRLDEDPACKAPPVYVRDADATKPASQLSFGMLPISMAEGLGGANVAYFWNARAHIGITGYGSAPKWLVDGVELDFQEFATRPFGGPFGALGVDAAYGFGVQDFFVEVSRSFDAQPNGGGGYGAVLRSVTVLQTTELDISVRYYGESYANPYARPVSAPDELDGLRARDETGGRLRTTSNFGRKLGLRSVVDVWHRLSGGGVNAVLFARVDVDLHGPWRWAFWTSYRSSNDQGLVTATRLACELGRRLTIAAQYQHEWVGLVATGGPRQDIAALLQIIARPIDRLRFRARARYDFDDIANNYRLAQVLWSYLEVAVTLRKRDALRLRYDVRVFLDRRESTLARVPNPEHWLSFEYSFRF